MRRTFIFLFYSTLFCGLYFSCKEKKVNIDLGITKQTKNRTFTLLNESTTGIDFTNHIKNQKDFNIFTNNYFYGGGGVSIGDINNDNLPDIYMTSNFGKNKLYLNRGDLKFEDISKNAGISGNGHWSTGVVMVDINADGLLDIYVCNSGNIKRDNQKNELFINNGNLTFTEKASEYNLAENGSTTHAAFFDYDKDGDLDAYILNNRGVTEASTKYYYKRDLKAKDWNVHKKYKGGGDKLFRNDNGKFVDVSEDAGIFGSLIGFGLGVTVGDVNGDLYADIYVSNDFYERDYLYINQKNGVFKEEIKKWVAHTSLSSMGGDMQDINNDGKPDIFVTDMLPEEDERLKNNTVFERYNLYKRKHSLGFHHQYIQNSLQLNTGNEKFSEIAYYSGVAKTDWSWGALIFDMDNDGHKDIYVCNGIYQDLTNGDFMDFFANDILQEMELHETIENIDSIISKIPSTPLPNYAFKNNQDLTFSDKTEDWGLKIPSFSNGAAYGDLDNDGDLDIVINNVNQKAFVFKNNTQETNPKNYIKIAFKGGANNTFAIGTIAELYVKDQIIRQELIPTRGYQSSMDYTMTIGIGKTKEIDSIKIYWPNNKTQTLKAVKANQSIILNQSDTTQDYYNTHSDEKTLLTLVPQKLAKHKEDSHVDFDYEGLISEMISQEGPAMAIGDINADGNDDIYIGGAHNQSGTVYLQNEDGKFTATTQKTITDDTNLEDTAATFFDANNDGSLDLLVASGGNNLIKSQNYKNRLYLNNGKGIFTKKTQLPATGHNVAVIATADYDKDGDLDVFIGSRSIPSIYGLNPKHLFLENLGDGTFKDVIESKAFDLKYIGMITDAKWADINGNGNEDLIVVGDWMAPKILKYDGRRLRIKKTSLDSLTGWWNTIEVTDINNDCFQDFILGNQGENIPYKASSREPIKLFVNDFDNNGTFEQIMTRTIDGKNMPIATKPDMTAQIASLKKENLRFSDYAVKTIEELFDTRIVKNSIIKSVVETKSILALNDGEGAYLIKPLPKEVQFSCVSSISCADVNSDGHLDVLLGGNNYELKPQYSRLDANYGSLLLGNGKGDLQWTPYSKSGFFLEGEVKHIRKVKNKNNETIFITTINNEAPQIFKVND